MNDSGANLTNPHYITQGKQTVLSQKPQGSACHHPSLSHFDWFTIPRRERTGVSVCERGLHTWSFRAQWHGPPRRYRG